MSDDDILQMAIDDDRVLITNDKDFGEKVFRQRRSHRGVVLLRLTNERSTQKIAVLTRLLVQYADQLAGRFVVVSESQVRFAR
jgi:predicted nuclease of predicted toxin-antitoxin system